MSTIEDRDDPAGLERNSDAIRADMNATLDALGRRLSPGQLMDRSAAYLRDNGGELAANFGRQVRENPIPAALTAVGLIWLIASQSRSHRASRSDTYYDPDESLPEDYEASEITPESSYAGSGTSTRLADAKERVHDKASHLKERVQGAAHRAREKLRSSGGHVRSGGGAAMHRVGSAARSTRAQALRAKDSFATMAEEQPLALGAIGIVIGAIVGACLPGTRREDELFGRARDRTLQRAREMGSEQYSHLRERAVTAAEHAKEAAKEAFRNEGGNNQGDTVGGAQREEGAFRGASTPAGRA